MLKNVQAVVLAGGISQRFQTGRTKLIEKICGKEMILYPLQLLDSLSLHTSLVLGFQQEQIKQVLQKYNLPNIHFLYQEKALGTGHAVQISESAWTQDHILILGADTPLLTPEIITKLCKKHIKTDADISFITAHGIDQDNQNYCRVFIQDNKIHVIDPTTNHPDLENQCCISGGVYIAKKSFLKKYIHQLTKSSFSNEFYLPEIVQIASTNNCKIVTIPVSFDAIRCIDTLSDLWAVEHIKRSQCIKHWMNHGVRFANALNVIIDEDVVIEPGSYIESGVHLLGKTTIKSCSKIGANSYIKNSNIEQNCTISPLTVIIDAIINKNCSIQPFSFINNQIITSQHKKTDIKQEKTISQFFTATIKTKETQQQDL